jgi:hypothetical protein
MFLNAFECFSIFNVFDCFLTFGIFLFKKNYLDFLHFLDFFGLYGLFGLFVPYSTHCAWRWREEETNGLLYLCRNFEPFCQESWTHFREPEHLNEKICRPCLQAKNDQKFVQDAYLYRRAAIFVTTRQLWMGVEDQKCQKFNFKQDWKSFQSLPASIILVYCIFAKLV